MTRGFSCLARHSLQMVKEKQVKRFLALLFSLVAGIVQAVNPPTGLQTSPVSTTGILLSWQDASANETGFRIEQAQSASGPWSEIATVGVNVTNYTASNLLPGTTYFFRVRSYIAEQSDFTPPASGTTPAPEPSVPTFMWNREL